MTTTNDTTTLAEMSRTIADLAGRIAVLSQEPEPAKTGTARGNGTDRQLPCDISAPAKAAPADPSASLVRQVIRQRRQRAKLFGADMFADPAWDMLLDLAAAQNEGRQVSVSSLCIASGVPSTTALRWIAQMTGKGLLKRVQDAGDRRRAYITLTERSRAAIARYFAEVTRVALAA